MIFKSIVSINITLALLGHAAGSELDKPKPHSLRGIRKVDPFTEIEHFPSAHRRVSGSSPGCPCSGVKDEVCDPSSNPAYKYTFLGCKVAMDETLKIDVWTCTYKVSRIPGKTPKPAVSHFDLAALLSCPAGTNAPVLLGGRCYCINQSPCSATFSQGDHGSGSPCDKIPGSDLFDSNTGKYDVGSLSTTGSFVMETRWKNVAGLGGAYMYHKASTQCFRTCITGPSCTPCYKALTLSPTQPQGRYDTVVQWDLSKSANPASLTGTAGKSAGTTVWELDATKTLTKSKYRVTGSLTIKNPNSSGSITLAVTAVLNPGSIPVAVTCGQSSVQYGQSVTCNYSKDLSADGSADSSITFTVIPNTAHYPPSTTTTAPFTYTTNPYVDDPMSLEDVRVGLSMTIHDTAKKQFDESFQCSSIAADYTKGGKIATYTNKADLKDSENVVVKTADATVTVECALAPLKVSKTAQGYTDDVTSWTLAKSASPGPTTDTSVFVGAAGLDVTWDWKLEVQKFVAVKKRVTGEVTINNDAAIPQTFTISDTLTPDICKEITSKTVPASGSLTCAYDTPVDSNNPPSSNTVTVTADGNPDQSAVADFGFVDGKHDGPQSVILIDGDHTWALTASKTETLSVTKPCSSTPSEYNGGVLTTGYANDAVLKDENGQILQQDDASVTVKCELAPLKVIGEEHGMYDKTITWTLDKVANQDKFVASIGQTVNWNWIVKAEKTVAVRNSKLLGSVTIKNPAHIPQTFGITSTLTPDLCHELASRTIGAGESVTCTIDHGVDPGNRPKQDVITVMAPGNAALSLSVPIVFTEHVIGPESVTLTDGDSHWELSGTDVKTLPASYACPTISTDGCSLTNDCVHEVSNTAALNGYGVNLLDSATVSITCLGGEVGQASITIQNVTLDGRNPVNGRFAIENSSSGLGTIAVLGPTDVNVYRKESGKDDIHLGTCENDASHSQILPTSTVTFNYHTCTDSNRTPLNLTGLVNVHVEVIVHSVFNQNGEAHAKDFRFDKGF